jgi:hypothetical protein
MDTEQKGQWASIDFFQELHGSSAASFESGKGIQYHAELRPCYDKLSFVGR